MKTLYLKHFYKIALLVLTLLVGGNSWGQMTATYNFAAPGAVTGLDANPPIALDANIGFASFKNSAGTAPGIFSGQLRLYQNATKGGSIKVSAQNGATITSVIVYATGTTGPAKYSVDGAGTTALTISGVMYTISAITATNEVEFWCVGDTSSKRIYVDKFEVTYTLSSSHTVTFNANGGTGTMANQSASGATDLTDNAFTRTAYEFGGWNTEADGSGTYYDNEASYPFDADVTLYAQWNPIITYDANGATTGTAPTTHATDNSGNITIKYQGLLLKDNNDFLGWATAPDGSGTTYIGGENANFSEPTTLYAKWILCAAPISSISPSSGAPVGTEITINVSGNYFTLGNSYNVTFNGSAAPTTGTALSTTQLKVTVPADATGGFVLSSNQSCGSVKPYTIITEDISGCN